MAQTSVAMPFLVVSLEGALRTAGQRYEVVAASLGAGPTTVFRRIMLPLVLPGLVSGAVLSFARSLGKFGGPSPSPAASRAGPGRCPWRSTSGARPTLTRRSRSRWCWSSSPCW